MVTCVRGLYCIKFHHFISDGFLSLIGVICDDVFLLPATYYTYIYIYSVNRCDLFKHSLCEKAVQNWQLRNGAVVI